MMAVYGYARVSKPSQVAEGVSLDDQERQIRGRCLERGWQLATMYVDAGKSASIPLTERPEGAKLLHRVRAADVVICTKLDRMFRNAREFLNLRDEWQAKRVSLYLLDLGGDTTGNGIGRLVSTVMAAVAEWERERIGERIRDAKAYQREARQWSGGTIPFGYQPVDRGDGRRRLAPVPEQQAIIAAMRERRQAGESLRSIMRWLEAEHGVKMALMSVQRILGRDEAKLPLL